MSPNERSAEWLRGAVAVMGRMVDECSTVFDSDLPHITQGNLEDYLAEYAELLDAAEAREGGEKITVNAGEVPDSWVKQRYLATQPTAAEVIEAFENIITRTYKTNKDMAIDKGFLHVASTLGEDYRKAIALCDRWKEANGGK